MTGLSFSWVTRTDANNTTHAARSPVCCDRSVGGAKCGTSIRRGNGYCQYHGGQERLAVERQLEEQGDHNTPISQLLPQLLEQELDDYSIERECCSGIMELQSLKRQSREKEMDWWDGYEILQERYRHLARLAYNRSMRKKKAQSAA